MSPHRRLSVLLAATCLAALAGCAHLGDTGGSQDLYDLGTLAPVREAPPITPAAIEVRSPSWLGRSAMQYRLDYEQPAQRRVYAQSRWVSPPAEMLERLLARAFARELHAAQGGAEACRIRIELDEFVQSFAAPGESESLILARAELLPARGEQRLATHLIAIRERAAPPDAAGGVTAHRAAAARLADDLADWLRALVKDSTSAASRCR